MNLLKSVIKNAHLALLSALFLTSMAKASGYVNPPENLSIIAGQLSARNAGAAFSEKGMPAVLLAPNVALCDNNITGLLHNTGYPDEHNPFRIISFYGQERRIIESTQLFDGENNGGPIVSKLSLLLLDQPINNVRYAALYGFNGEDTAAPVNCWATSYSRGNIIARQPAWGNQHWGHFAPESFMHMGRVYVHGPSGRLNLITRNTLEHPHGPFGNHPLEAHRKVVPTSEDQGTPLYYFHAGALKLLGLYSKELYTGARDTYQYTLVAPYKTGIEAQLQSIRETGSFIRTTPYVPHDTAVVRLTRPQSTNGQQYLWNTIPRELFRQILNLCSQGDRRCAALACRFFYHTSRDLSTLIFRSDKSPYYNTPPLDPRELSAIVGGRAGLLGKLFLLRCPQAMGQPFVECMRAQPNLRTLRVHRLLAPDDNNKLSDQNLTSGLSHARGLTSLSLMGQVQLSTQGLPLALEQCPNLVDLGLRCIPTVTDDSLLTICRQHMALQRLDLGRALIMTADITGPGLIAALAHTPALIELSVEGRDNISCPDLVQALTPLHHLQKLNLMVDRTRVGMTNDTLVEIARATPQLRHLFLDRESGITGQGLLNAAQHWTHLERLSVIGCDNISDQELIDIVARYPTLVKIWFFGNYRPVAAAAIPMAMQRYEFDPNR